MHDAYRPVNLIVALWPTGQFEFPNEVAPFAERLRERFPEFVQQRVVQRADAPMPPEMARLALVTGDRQWALELAPAKLALRRANTGNLTFERFFEDLIDRTADTHTWLAENMNLRVWRIGLVAQFVCQTRSSAGERIAEYFLQPRARQGQPIHEAQVGVLARLTLANRFVNRWLRVRPLRTNDARRLDLAAQIEIDVNTMVEETAHKTGRDITEFLEGIREHLATDIPVLEDADFFQ